MLFNSCINSINQGCKFILNRICTNCAAKLLLFILLRRIRCIFRILVLILSVFLFFVWHGFFSQC